MCSSKPAVSYVAFYDLALEAVEHYFCHIQSPLDSEEVTDFIDVLQLPHPPSRNPSGVGGKAGPDSTTETVSKGKLSHTEGHGSSGEEVRKGIVEVAFELILKSDFHIFNGISKAQRQHSW